MIKENSLTTDDLLNSENLVSGTAMNVDGEQEPTINEYIQVASGVRLFVRDCGQGKPIILIHGWPLNNDMWEYQVDALVTMAAGNCIR